MTYYARVTSAVNKALSAGWTLPQALEGTPLWDEYALPPNDPGAGLQVARHRYNVRKTFLSLTENRG